jgi:hypothetical protein
MRNHFGSFDPAKQFNFVREEGRVYNVEILSRLETLWIALGEEETIWCVC